MAYDANTCADAIHDDHPDAILCDGMSAVGYQFHCTEVQNANHAYCQGKPMYYPIPVPVCQLADGSVVYFPGEDSHKRCSNAGGTWIGICYCCCSCMAYGTPVAVPGGERRIETFLKGDQVLAGSLTQGGGGAEPELTWETKTVGFSDGTASETSQNTVYLAYGEDGGPVGDLVCSHDQVLMLADGSLVRASQVHVRDRLMGRDRTPMPVRSVAIGEYTGGVHHIGVATPGDTTDGHLLVASGIVVGDYYLQLRFDSVPHHLKAADLHQRPHLWDAAYSEVHGSTPQPATVVFSADGSVNGAGARETTVTPVGTFTSFAAEHPALPRERTAALLTDAQSADIARNAPQVHFANPVRKALMDTVVRHLRGFYPGVHLHVEWARQEPNVYAFHAYGRKTVVITGGLARVRDMQFEGLTMAVAHGIQRLSALPPVTPRGFTGTAAADYYAFGTTSRWIWWGDQWLSNYEPACAQFEKLFGFIDPANAQGDPADPLGSPSIECRQSSIGATAMSGLPECAGGPPAPRIALEEATATPDSLTLLLNMAPTAETAEDPRNYVIEPEVPIRGVTLHPASALHVQIDAAFTPKSEYRVTIRDLRSHLDTGVDPEHATRPFTVQPTVPAGV